MPFLLHPGLLVESSHLLRDERASQPRRLVPGRSLIISPTEQYNGCYGWLEFSKLIDPPFVTVAQTGSIGEAFVQTEPCAVNDDCLILLEKNGIRTDMSDLVLAAASLQSEKWRFNLWTKADTKKDCRIRYLLLRCSRSG